MVRWDVRVPGGVSVRTGGGKRADGGAGAGAKERGVVGEFEPGRGDSDDEGCRATVLWRRRPGRRGGQAAQEVEHRGASLGHRARRRQDQVPIPGQIEGGQQGQRAESGREFDQLIVGRVDPGECGEGTEARRQLGELVVGDVEEP